MQPLSKNGDIYRGEKAEVLCKLSESSLSQLNAAKTLAKTERKRLNAEFSCKPNAESLLYAEAPPKIATFPPEKAEIAQLVEHDLAKVGVAGSSPVFRSHRKKETCRTAVLHFFPKFVDK